MSRNAFLAHGIARHLGVDPGHENYEALMADLRQLKTGTLILLHAATEHDRTCSTCGDTCLTMYRLHLCKECAK